MMAEGDRLRRLQMGEAGHHGIGVGQRLFDQRVLQIGQLPIERVDRVADIKPHVSRDLIVARTCGVKSASRGADQFGKAAFDIHMDVFKRAGEGEIAFFDLLSDLIEAIFLIRAARTTLARFGYSDPLETRQMRVKRRVSAAFKDIPGGQILGPTFDYTHRLLDFALAAGASPRDESADVVDGLLRDALNRARGASAAAGALEGW